MNRVIFFIDGFNLYHSVVDASFDSGMKGKGTKWLDIASLCKSFLHLISTDAVCEKIIYITAFAYHLTNNDPNKILRHKLFALCLEDSGIEVITTQFKKKIHYHIIQINNRFEKRKFKSYEEKETDVALGVLMMHEIAQNNCDTIALITGDTDLLPALQVIKENYKNIQIIVIFPYKRKNRELQNYAHKYFKISKEQYFKHQFPDTLILKSGRNVNKPSSW